MENSNSMKIHLVVLFFLSSLLMHLSVCAQSDPIAAYVSQYQDLAIREMHRTGIPASIKLAQAILESDAGRSELARGANNHFGIKCGEGWSGPTYGKKDDEGGFLGIGRKKSCFRQYPTPYDSFYDHSEFLSNRERYAFLFDIKPGKYKKWAKGLKKAGYATSNRYPKRLIDLIERYNLDRLDSI